MKASSIGTRRLALIGLGILLVAAMSYVVMRSGPLAPTRVTVVQAAEGQITPQLFGIGTVEARRSYLIGPATAGRVRSGGSMPRLPMWTYPIARSSSASPSSLAAPWS